MDEKEIIIIVRDCNGKRTELKFSNRDKLMDFISSGEPEKRYLGDEILIVIWNNISIFNILQSTYSIIWEDISGFFA